MYASGRGEIGGNYKISRGLQVDDIVAYRNRFSYLNNKPAQPVTSMTASRRSMHNKVAVVTGGSNGIGKSTALERAKRGTEVILTYNSDKKGAGSVVQDIKQQSTVHAVALQLDLRQKSSFKDFAQLAKNALGELWQRKTFDYLVNNGGIGGGMMFTEVTED